MRNNQPLVSVIVPVYKVEAYLDDCVESIVEQTYTNLEIILVDDGSPDKCPEMCDEWAQKDLRIKVIHKQNGGLSDARNAGLDIATGDYIAFVDSDDLIDVHMMSVLVRNIEEHHADIAECNFTKFTDAPIKDGVQDCSSTVYDMAEALEELICENDFRYTVWNKLYQKQIFEDLRFEVGKLHEDVFFSYQAFGKSKVILKTSESLYFYRQREDSITGSTFSKRTLDSLDARCLQLEYIRKNFPELEGVAQRQLIGSCMYFCQLALFSNDVEIKKYAVEKTKRVFEREKTCLKYKATGSQKLWIQLAKISFKKCCKIRNFLKIGL